MAAFFLVNADLRITHGDEVITVKGHGEKIEVSHSSIRFFFKTLRNSFAVKYKNVLAIDQLLRGLGLTVVLKTKYLCFKILGVKAGKWVRFAFRFVLPS